MRERGSCASSASNQRSSSPLNCKKSAPVQVREGSKVTFLVAGYAETIRHGTLQPASQVYLQYHCSYFIFIASIGSSVIASKSLKEVFVPSLVVVDLLL